MQIYDNGNAAPKIYQLPQNLQQQQRRQQPVNAPLKTATNKIESRKPRPKKPVRQCSKNETGCTNKKGKKKIPQRTRPKIFLLQFHSSYFLYIVSLAVSAEIASGHKLTAWGPDTPHTPKDTDTDTFCGRTQAHAKRDKHTQNHLKSTMMTLMSVPSSPPWITPAGPPAPWSPLKPRQLSFQVQGSRSSLLPLMTQKYEYEKIKQPRPHPKSNNKGHKRWQRRRPRLRQCQPAAGRQNASQWKAPAPAPPQSQKCAI